MQGRIDFNIQKKSDISTSFRVEKVKKDFDLQADKIEETFEGCIELPDEWQIGVIVGGSGTGKTTIARQVFSDALIEECKHESNCVIDDMPKESTIDEISNMFFSVGFASVPSWLKPYNVLSNGEKMRVDLASAL